jgi:hypothetical protein
MSSLEEGYHGVAGEKSSLLSGSKQMPSTLSSSSLSSSGRESSSFIQLPRRTSHRWCVVLTGLVATMACAFGVVVTNTTPPSWWTKNQSVVIDGNSSSNTSKGNGPSHADDALYRHYKRVNSHLPTNSKYKYAQYFGYQLYAGGAPAFIGKDGMALHRTADEAAVAMAAAKKNKTMEKETMVNPECIAAGGKSFGTVATDTDPVLQCYLGYHDDLEDVARRLEVMKAAVEKAYLEADHSNHTLKVFIAPEFFWRGLAGAYGFQNLDHVHFDDCQGAICAILAGLEKIVEDKRFEDWFFLFGTVLARQELPEARDDDPYKYLYHNFAPIYKGFDPDSTIGNTPRRDAKGKRFLLPKRVVSTSDFLTPSYKLGHEAWLEHSRELLGEQNQPNTPDNPFYFRRARYDDEGFYKFKEQLWETASYAMLEFDWLMVDGLSVAIEICVDHYKGIALNGYLGDIVKGRKTRIPSSDDNVASIEYVPIPPYQAQIQMVSSAGMTAIPKSFALAENGLLFHQDGLSNNTSSQYMDSDLWMQCDQGVQFEGGTEAIRRRAIVSPTDVNFLYEVIQPIRKVKIFEDPREALKGVFSAVVYEPHLLVHEPLALPEVNEMNGNGVLGDSIDPGA